MAEIIERLAAMETVTANLDCTIKVMEKDIKDIKEKLLDRPSWTVSILITILTTVCTGLLIYIVTAR